MIKALLIYELLMLVTLLMSIVVYSSTGKEFHLRISQASFAGLVSPLMVVFLLLSLVLVVIAVLALPVLLPISVLLGDTEDEL